MNAITTSAPAAPARFAASIRALVLALCASLCVACAGTGSSEADWVEGEIAIPTERLLRQISALSLKRNGFPPGTEAAGEQTTVSSSWRVQLQPFKGEGTRTKAHVRYGERRPGVWNVSVRVEKETNEELAKPLELARAKWESAPDDRGAANRILRTMQTLLGGEYEHGATTKPDDVPRDFQN